MRALDVPRICALTRDSVRSPFAVRYLAHRARNGDIFSANPDRSDEWAEAYTHCEYARFSGAALYYVSADMVDLARHAAESMPDWSLSPTDLPSRSGFMVFAHPVLGIPAPDGEARLQYGAVSWGPPDFIDRASFNGPGVRSTWYVNREAQEQAELQVGSTYFGEHPAPPLVLETLAWNRYHSGTGTFRVTDMTGDSVEVEAEDMLQGRYAKTKVLLTLWRLMRQSLCVSQPMAPVNAAQRKQARRDDIDLERIRVIRLRHRSTGSASDRGNREYLHRWIVNGHWRNHWYPKQERHVPTWIAPYVKGPEGSPLLTGEKVYALVQ